MTGERAAIQAVWMGAAIQFYGGRLLSLTAYTNVSVRYSV